MGGGGSCAWKRKRCGAARWRGPSSAPASRSPPRTGPRRSARASVRTSRRSWRTCACCSSVSALLTEHWLLCVTGLTYVHFQASFLMFVYLVYIVTIKTMWCRQYGIRGGGGADGCCSHGTVAGALPASSAARRAAPRATRTSYWAWQAHTAAVRRLKPF